ncbi:hypothetical protein C1I91_18140 [Clostridium manihotivorum]|uniref:Uncharacterized protein n=1 Tax=Clostridium manihotivorum TaxID=2320868 RepID=A0A3R5UGV5_9CLOT|nr:hypothetical protein C1I91_18140 [Clostridium manihotivorum]
MVLSNNALVLANKQKEATFQILPSMLLVTLVFIGLGVLLGIERLAAERKKNGIWKINLPKLIFLGIPSLYFSLGIFLYYSSISFVRDIIAYPLDYFFNNNVNILSLFQVILGYVIISSFTKVDN